MKKVSITELSRFWWWVLLCALIGSALVNAISYLIPPQYESRTAVTASFDFSNSAYWNDITMLKFTQSMEKALYSADTLIAVIIQADQLGIELTETSFRSHTFVEQHNYGWALTAHFKDPVTAKTVADLWGSILQQALLEDRQILLRISEENQTYNALIECMQLVTAKPDHPTCNLENLPALQRQMQALTQDNKQSISELQYLPMIPAEFTVVQSLEVTSPVPYISTFEAALPLIGALLGITAGIYTLIRGIPQNILKKVSPFPFEP